MNTVYIGLGSNIDAEAHLRACADILRADYPDVIFSSVYKTAAMEREDQDDFLNAVAKIETDETPEEVHATLQQIEKDLGKNPPYPKGPRTIDLDILLYGDWVIHEGHETGDMRHESDCALAIPHPKMHERRFVLEPLCELIDVKSVHPRSKKQWNALLLKNMHQIVERTDMRLET